MFRKRSWYELSRICISKGKLFEELKGTFDYTLPQWWLDKFAKYCIEQAEENEYDILVTYDLIASSTVWYYPPSGRLQFSGMPVFGCIEVETAYRKYEKSENDAYSRRVIEKSKKS